MILRSSSTPAILVGGPSDGHEIDINSEQSEWEVTQKFPPEQNKDGIWFSEIKTVYRRTSATNSKNRVIFSCIEKALFE
jgi:hypothetical protein